MKKVITLLLVILFAGEIQAQSDTPCAAPLLQVHASVCSFTTGTTVGATYQTDPANGGTPTCASPGSPDVWYAFIVPASGAVAITTQQGTITDAGLEIYNGPCTNLQFIECDDDDAVGMMPVIDRSDFTPGDTIYVRVWRGWNPGTGTFNICFIESHSDCISATPLCAEATIDGNAYGPGSNQDAFANFCGISEFQSHWIKFKIQSSGILQFTIFPDSIGPGIFPDYDWMLWQGNNQGFCANFNNALPPLACNGSSSMGAFGETGLDPSGVSFSVPPGAGNPFCPLLTATTGEVYYLFLNNFATSSSGFFFTFNGSTCTFNCDFLTGIFSEEAESISPGSANFSLKESLKVAPNPFADQITVSAKTLEAGPLTLTLRNIVGEAVYTFGEIHQGGKYIKTLFLSNLPAQIYSLELKSGGETAYRKIVKH